MGFFFPTAHYAVAWLVLGALLLHVAVKLPVARTALSTPLRRGRAVGAVAPDDRDSSDRRAFLRTSAGVAGIAVLATAGVTVPWLRRVSPLAWRSASGPQGVPINRTAAAAHRRPAGLAAGDRLAGRAPHPVPGRPGGPAAAHGGAADRLRRGLERLRPLDRRARRRAAPTGRRAHRPTGADLLTGDRRPVRGQHAPGGPCRRPADPAGTADQRRRAVSRPRISLPTHRPEPSGRPPDQVGCPAGGAAVRVVRLLLLVLGAASAAYGGWLLLPSSAPPCRGWSADRCCTTSWWHRWSG
ncbi:hypothetical protein NKG94_01775 [Micromonospora sp. M12]